MKTHKINLHALLYAFFVNVVEFFDFLNFCEWSTYLKSCYLFVREAFLLYSTPSVVVFKNIIILSMYKTHADKDHP